MVFDDLQLCSIKQGPLFQQYPSFFIQKHDPSRLLKGPLDERVVITFPFDEISRPRHKDDMRIRGKIPANPNLNRVKLPIEFYLKTTRTLPEATQSKHDIHHNHIEVPTTSLLKRKRRLEDILSDGGSSGGSSDETLVDESATHVLARKAKRFCVSSSVSESSARPAKESEENLKPDWKRLAATYIPKRFHHKEPWEYPQRDSARRRDDRRSRREISVPGETRSTSMTNRSSNPERTGSQRKARVDEVMKDYHCEVKECEYSLTRCIPRDVRQRKIDAHKTAHKLWKEEGWVLPGLRKWYKIVET